MTEAESRFDGDICRVLINDGKADPSHLDVVQYNRGPRSPRSAIAPETLPTSPRLTPRSRVHRQRSEPLCPVVVYGKQLLVERSVSADTVPAVLTDGISLRQRSFDSCSTTSFTESESDLPGVQEEDELDDADPDDLIKGYGSLLQRRRNSKSLPDLRDVITISGGSSPCGSPRLSADESYPHSKGRYERSHTLEEAQLPSVHEDEESDEDDQPPPDYSSRRRGSISLPDLRACGTFLVAQAQLNSRTASKESIGDNNNRTYELNKKDNKPPSPRKPNAAVFPNVRNRHTPKIGHKSQMKDPKELTASLVCSSYRDS